MQRLLFVSQLVFICLLCIVKCRSQSYYGVADLLPLYEAAAGTNALRLPGGIYLDEDNSGITYKIPDQLGSARLLINRYNKIQVSLDYDPYGAIAGNVSSETDGRYTGSYSWDPTTGLYSSPGRKYDPLSRRFLSIDPVKQGHRSYTYVAGNPVSYIDPDGRVIRIAWEDGAGTTKTSLYTYEAERVFDEQASVFLKNTTMALDRLYLKEAMIVNMRNADPPRMTNVLEDLMAHPAGLTIKSYFKNSYMRNIESVNFNDIEGTKILKDLSLGGIPGNVDYLSPMAGLAHELLHVWNARFDNKNYLERKVTRYNKQEFPFFPNEEERYVTLDLEPQVHEKLGEALRSSYRPFGRYPAKNAVSIESIPRPLPPPPPPPPLPSLPSPKLPDTLPIPGGL